ncbi:MAG: hypothetical protein EOO05_03470 [Chitinophagaceae bacterium]|nr:MAG: hypothetical protein EOO05_03470 [Chitinophagaceae bacterium]
MILPTLLRRSFRRQYLTFYSLCLLALVLCLTSPSSAQNLRADGQRIVNDKNENVILRGMGLGGWMLQEGYMLKIYEEGSKTW